MRERLANRFETIYIIVALLMAIPAFVFSIAAYAHVIRSAFSLEALIHPKSLAEFLPDGTDSPRYQAILELAERYPPGSIGLDARTYRILPNRERVHGNEACYIGLDNIVHRTGQPVRFIKTPPPSVRYILKFIPRTSGVPDLGPPADPEPIETFEDMGLYRLKEPADVRP